MPNTDALADHRLAIRNATLTDETALVRALVDAADIGEDRRRHAQNRAAEFVRDARARAGRASLIDKFLQEYGLSTAEGVTLMRLAEALLRTPDAATADALIEDKVEAGDWAAHTGKSPFPLVNFSTRALMMTAAWLDDIEAKDPARRLLKSTKQILDRVGDPVIRAAVGQAMRVMGEHFVLGETIEAALKRGETFSAQGYLFSFDMLGEAAHTQADADKYFDDYKRAIASIGARAASDRPEDNPGISIKLSALYPRYEYAKKERVIQELGGRLRLLALDAKAANIGFNIDAEEAARLDLSLDLIEAIMRDPAFAGWRGFGVVVQAYQRRAKGVLHWLAALARDGDRRIMVRLVKGAYWDAEIKRAQVLGLESYPVFTRKVSTDVSYLACARLLLEQSDVIYPQFATHNALTAAMVREMAGDRTDYELQRLHGMGEALHDRLIERGARSRIYAPVGGHKELLPYLVRRLLENGANSSFVNQLFDPDLSVEDVVSDPIDEALGLAAITNGAIPAPRDLFGGVRLSARGHDVADPVDVALLVDAVSLNRLAADEIIVGPLIAGRIETDNATPRFSPNDLNRRVALVRDANADDVVRAMRSAEAAQGSWARRDATSRSDCLRKAADLLEARAPDFMRLAVHEAGKTIPDAIAEVREAIDFLRYYAAEAKTQEAPGLGVIACISPWNFPLAIFLGQVSAALAAGNAVIAKPAEQTPAIAFAAVQLLHEAGVPPNILHFLPGDGPTVGAPLISQPGLAGVIFTGSTTVAKSIDRMLAGANPGAMLIAETGGINAMIVDSTALLEQAVADTANSAFQSAGQRCSACRIVCVQSDIADRFCEMLAGAMAELTIGEPSSLDTDIGPVIDNDAYDSITLAIDALRRTGRLVAEVPRPALTPGHFVAPIAFEVDRVSSVSREIFGPVLQIVRFEGGRLHALIDEINALGYGLTMGVHSRIDETMHDVASRALIGNIYINRNQIGAVVGVQPFGGDRLSGTGPKAGGPHYIPALGKPAPGEGARIRLTERAPPALYDQIVARSDAALRRWSLRRDRPVVLAAASAHASGDAAEILKSAASIARAVDAPVELPGPTGEANTLKLRARGLVACLGPSPSAFADQAAKALGLGNAVLCDEAIAGGIASALITAGAPPGLLEGLPFGGDIPAAIISDQRIAAIAVDADDAGRTALRRLLSERGGPIPALLTGADAAARYGTERTIAVNTTAAGGDVRLLALPE